MGYFNPITYFIKSFIRLFTRKFFWVLLILILLFVGFVLYDKGVFAETSTYGNYNGFSSSEIDFINSQIEIHKGDYDSFCARYFYDEPNGSKIINLYFYNYNTLGKLYKIDVNNSAYPYRCFNVLSKSNVNSSVFRVNFLYPYSSSNYTSGYLNTINFAVSSLSTSKTDYCIYTNRDIYYDSNFNNVFFTSTNKDLEVFVNPEITNSSNDISGLTFDTLDIQLNSADFPTNTMRTLLNVQYTAEDENQFTIDISKYANSNDSTIYVPKLELIKNMVLSTSFNVSFTLLYSDTAGNIYNNYSLGSYYVSISQDTVNALTEFANKETQNNIENNTDKTAEGIENINNSITDSNVDDSSVEDFSSLGSGFETEDVSGIDQLFQKLYDAFCTDEVQEVSLTIPFVNKSFIINTTNVSDKFPEPVKNTVALFVWGVIGLWVLKDIRTIIDKISEGSPENVGSDVKKEVL